jgi:hypothetical protein
MLFYRRNPLFIWILSIKTLILVFVFLPSIKNTIHTCIDGHIFVKRGHNLYEKLLNYNRISQ